MTREDKKRWSFPKYSGSVGFGEDVKASMLSTHLAACLRDVGAWEVIVDGDRITFKGSAIGTFAGPMRNVLAPFGCGELEIDSAARQVRYRLCVAHLIAFATVAVGFMGAILLCVRFLPSQTALILPIVWILFVGGNLLLGIPIFTGFLHQSISSAPKTSAYEGN